MVKQNLNLNYVTQTTTTSPQTTQVLLHGGLLGVGLLGLFGGGLSGGVYENLIPLLFLSFPIS